MKRMTSYWLRTTAARNLREAETLAEEKLWSRLRASQLGGFKFRRQFPMGPYFADFCCLSKRLIIELDGGYHRETIDTDENRSHYFKERGFRVIRFWNKEVLGNFEEVCESILFNLK
jgi:very-short-patch-repair endonuclease